MQQSHTYRIRTSQRTDQKCGKIVPAPTREEFQNFFSPALRKKLKHAIAQPDKDRQKSEWTTTRKTQADSNFQTRWTRTPAANMRLASCGVKCLNSSAVFQFNFSAGLPVLCPESPHERQAQKRYKQALKTTPIIRLTPKATPNLRLLIII